MSISCERVTKMLEGFGHGVWRCSAPTFISPSELSLQVYPPRGQRGRLRCTGGDLFGKETGICSWPISW